MRVATMGLSGLSLDLAPHPPHHFLQRSLIAIERRGAGVLVPLGGDVLPFAGPSRSGWLARTGIAGWFGRYSRGRDGWR